MAVDDFFAGEIATELIKSLIQISRKACPCKSTAESLMASINELLPTIQEVKFSGVELPQVRQSQLDRLSETLQEGLELCKKVLSSTRWNVYRNLQLARKMEKLEKRVNMFFNGPIQAHVLADVHHLRFESAERFDRLENRIGEMRIGFCRGGGGVAVAVAKEEVEEGWGEEEGSLGNMVCGVGVEVGKRKVKELVMEDGAEFNVVGIVGIGGSGKTTLASQVCRDDQVRCYFKDRILFLTVSQSPNLGSLKARIRGFIAGNSDAVVMGGHGDDGFFPYWSVKSGYRIDAVKKLIVLDDVWSLSVLEQLVSRAPGLKTLVVSRFKFPTVFSRTYEVELLRKDEALSLFCLSAFGQKSIPSGADANLVKQIVDECEGLPLALKVIGASLRDQNEMYWASAKKRLSKGEPICDAHKNKVLDRMAISVDFLSRKVKECFLDLGCFPEDKKIPLDVLINMWVEIHGLDEDEAFAILVELADKNLLTLVKDPRWVGDVYSCYYDISVAQHDVLRDLAIHLSSHGEINDRKRLLMPRRETELPREWENNADQPFNARIVSVHTGEMQEMDWPQMDFPKAEVLILNFAGKEYFLPPFIDYMPKLRALIVINYSNSNATLKNFSVFCNTANLRSLWLEKVSVAHLTESTIPLRKLRKISLVLCKINDSLDQSKLCQIFPSLVELTIDHCDDLLKLPPSTCSMHSLKSLSITNCHNLHELPANLGDLKSLQILRLYACPTLKMLPPSVCELACLKHMDISQCVDLRCLPEWIGRLSRLEKIDMRECPLVCDLPKSAASLESLRAVICDEEVSWLWKEVGRANLHVQVAEKCFSLYWLDE